MTDLERDILRGIIELQETLDASLGDQNNSELLELKGKVQALDLLARIEADKQKDSDWRQKLKALEPLLIFLTVAALLVINLFGITLDPTQVLP